MATKRNSENKIAMPTGAGAAPARRKSNTPNRVSRPAAPAVVSSTPAVVSGTPAVVSAKPIVEGFSEAVARLAYTYWAGRGYQGGSPEEDWLRAEQEVRAATSSK